MTSKPGRTLRLKEGPDVPWLSVVLGFGPMLPILAGAGASWAIRGGLRIAIIGLTLVWAATILAFLAGVRRGLSFRTEGGPANAQLATMVVLFSLAFAALVLTVYDAPDLAAALILAGFGLVLALDPVAASDGQAPLFFAKLRPPQMTLGSLALVALLLNLLIR